MKRRRPSRRTASIVMWTGIGASALLLLALLARGWGRDAWTTAVAVLLLLCVATCVWAGVVADRSARDVTRTADQLAAARRAAARGLRRDADAEDGVR